MPTGTPAPSAGGPRGWALGPPGPHPGGLATAFGPGPPSGPIPDRGRRSGARSIDVLIHLALLIPVLLLVRDWDHRPYTAWMLWWALIVLYEMTMVLTVGSTLGKLATGIRIAPLDGISSPSPIAAFRRAAVGSALELLPVLGWTILLIGLLDPLSRGVADRAARTIVVRRDASLPVRSRDLPGYADHLRPPRVTVRGRVGDLDVRARARLRRLNGAPALILATALLAFIASLPDAGAGTFLIATAVWTPLFVIDETVRLSRTGRTPGHALAGLIVVVQRTGERPSAARSLLRSVVFGLSAYTLIGFVLLGISAIMIRSSSTGRALHDLVAGTIVVADPELDPEIQRQRAMRMRLGEVA